MPKFRLRINLHRPWVSVCVLILAERVFQKLINLSLFSEQFWFMKEGNSLKIVQSLDDPTELIVRSQKERAKSGGHLTGANSKQLSTPKSMNAFSNHHGKSNWRVSFVIVETKLYDFFSGKFIILLLPKILQSIGGSRPHQLWVGGLGL